MRKRKIGLILAMVILVIIFLEGCATIPQETIELSYIIEENIVALKTSYILLVNTHFDLLEKIRIGYLEEEWIPAFIDSWVNDGRLIDMASGKVIWSPEHNDFIQPERGLERQGMLTSTTFWSIAATEQIEEKRKELINPLEDQRKGLLRIIEDGFDRLLRGNIAITAHLNSIQKVKEFQNNVFDSLKAGDLQNEINKQLVEISRYADQGLEVIKKADGLFNMTNQMF
jgi:hypothetical protein